MRLIWMMGGGDIGGAKTHIFSLVRELGKQHEICVVSFRDGPFPQEMMVEGIRVELVLARSPAAARDAVLQLVDAMHPALIHCHGGRANMIGALVRQKREIPVITTVHSDYKLDYLGSPLKQYTLGTVNAVALRRLDYYQAVADPMARTLISRGFDPQRILNIYNGMDFSDPIRGLDRTAYCREQWGIEVDDSMVLCGLAARLTAVKDLPTALDGFAMAAQRQPQLRLFLAGTGEDEQKLRSQVNRLGVSDKVVFCGWVTEIAPFFAAMDITLLTSVSETFPYSILEGIREGCVPVCSDVGGMSELIDDGETGCIFQPGDTEALAEALTVLAADDEKRHIFAAKQHKRAVERYSIDAMCRTQEENYRHFLARFARRNRTRDGAVLTEHTDTEQDVAAVRRHDPEEPICVISPEPMAAKLRYRTQACTAREAPRQLKHAQRYVCSGEDRGTAEIAKRLGCQIQRNFDKSEGETGGF